MNQTMVLCEDRNKTDRHDITEILLKVALNTIKQTIAEKQHTFIVFDLTRAGIIPTSYRTRCGRSLTISTPNR